MSGRSRMLAQTRCVGDRGRYTLQTQLANFRCSLYVLILSNLFSETSPTCLNRSSSLRRPVRQKTSAPLLVFATERFSRPRAIYSTCLSRRMLCRPGSGGRRYFCVPKVSTTLARQREGTKPPSSKPFARHSAAPNEFGSPPIAIAKVSSSVRKFSSITSTAAWSCGSCLLRRTRRPFAMHSAGQSQMPSTLVFTQPPSRGGRPTRSTIYHLPAPRPSSWEKARGGS